MPDIACFRPLAALVALTAAFPLALVSPAGAAAGSSISTLEDRGVITAQITLDPQDRSAWPIVVALVAPSTASALDPAYAVRSSVVASAASLDLDVPTWGIDRTSLLYVVGCRTPDLTTCRDAAGNLPVLARTSVALHQTPITVDFELPPTSSWFVPEQRGFVTADLGGGGVMRCTGCAPGTHADLERVQVVDPPAFIDVVRCSAQLTRVCEHPVTGPLRTVIGDATGFAPPLAHPGDLPEASQEDEPNALLLTYPRLSSPFRATVQGVDQQVTWSLEDSSGATVVPRRTGYTGTGEDTDGNRELRIPIVPSRDAGRTLADGRYTVVATVTYSNQQASKSFTARLPLVIGPRTPTSFDPDSDPDGYIITPDLVYIHVPGPVTAPFGATFRNSGGVVVHTGRNGPGYNVPCDPVLGCDPAENPFQVYWPPPRTLPRGLYYPEVYRTNDHGQHEIPTHPYPPLRIGSGPLEWRTRTVRVPVADGAEGTGRCSSVIRPGPRGWPGSVALLSNQRCTGTAADGVARVQGTLRLADPDFNRLDSVRTRFYGGATLGKPASTGIGRTRGADGRVLKSARLDRAVGWHPVNAVRVDPDKDGPFNTVPWSVESVLSRYYEVKFVEVTARYRAYR